MSSAALASIHAAFAQSVSWRQDGESPFDCTAILFHGIPNSHYDAGSSVRKRGYEVQTSALPFRPRNGDLVIDDGTAWRVIEVIDYDEAEAWRVYVDKRA
jgi:hypothetical protein